MPGAPVEATRASIAAMVRHNRASAKSHSGIWRDIAVRKRKTEIDAQIAIIARIAREAGVKTPLIERLVDLIHDVEDGRRPQDWSTLDALATQEA
jgi:2-dehydropantoate 2-reductase